MHLMRAVVDQILFEFGAQLFVSCRELKHVEYCRHVKHRTANQNGRDAPRLQIKDERSRDLLVFGGGRLIRDF